jgi:sugar phosphate isomerase/epimerase
MKIAYSTLACPDWKLEQAVEAALRYGYEGLELRLLDGELLTPDLDSRERRRVRSVCAEAGLPIICVDTSLCIAQPNSAARSKLMQDGERFLEMAAEWGAAIIRVFGGPPAGTSAEVARVAAVETLAPLAERAAALGLAVALETHDAFSSGADAAHILEKIPGSGVGVVWDLLNSYCTGEAINDTLASLRKWLLHVHIKDGKHPAAPGEDWSLTLLGEGEFPMRQALALLHEVGYEGWLSVEWEKKWLPDLAEPDVALPQHASVLREYLAELE